ncbi:MAG: ABC transporter ATP-binding protein [Phycisphaeraceae bacterium]|nr:ABC transporter ATP-binding protein [Phycisphaeraceae bacterium]
MTASASASGPDSKTIVSLRKIHKSFGRQRVLRSISLDFERGKTTVVLGPSGCGKSVLLKHIVRLLEPDRGEVWFDGQRIDGLSERELVKVRTQFGYLFQMGALFDSMDVQQNVQFPLIEHTKMTPAQRLERSEEVIGLVGLDGTQHKYPSELSGGQRKRIALARAIVMHPKVILYDEPTTGLDPIRADIINGLIIKLQHELKATSIVVTHDMNSAAKIADRIVMLYDGNIIADGRPEQIILSEDPMVRGFVDGQAFPDDKNIPVPTGDASP